MPWHYWLLWVVVLCIAYKLIELSIREWRNDLKSKERDLHARARIEPLEYSADSLSKRITKLREKVYYGSEE
jgi:hypothetical protein